MSPLPTGTVTFVFTDIEGSTALLRRDAELYREALQHQANVIRVATERHQGRVVSTEGDSFFLVFVASRDAVEAAAELQRGLAAFETPIAVRVGIHTGDGVLGGDNYLGIDVHRAARIAAAGHGGQVLLSQTTTALLAQPLTDGLGLRPLGSFRLKDFDRAEPITQLVIPGLESSFPPLRTGAVGNLPAIVTTFVVRSEFAAVAGRLDESRLVTLTGPGGTGKTRLAIEVGRSLADRFPDGVWFVALAALTDPALISSNAAMSLGLTSGPDDPTARILAHFQDRRLLLILDNFEHLLTGAAQIAHWLEAASGLTLMVTSRGPLHLRGETEVPIPPLTDENGVHLFVERARAAQPELELDDSALRLVGEIVDRVDRLPLAIELAASRVRILSLGSIASRLDSRLSLLTGGARDAPERHRTLRATFDWSYELLSAPSQKVFAQLSVFSGGFDLEQAEAVTDNSDLLDLLTDLVDQSLLRLSTRPGRTRFVMLATIREYAQDLLDSSDEAELIRRRHAEAYLDLATRASPGFIRRQSRHWLDIVEGDHDNLRSALAWAISSGEGRLAQMLCWHLWRFFQMRGYIAQGREWVTKALAIGGGDRQSRMRAEEAGGGLAYWQADLSAAAEHYERALALAREGDDPVEIAQALSNRAVLRGVADGTAAAIELLDEALALVAGSEDRELIGRLHWAKGASLFLHEDPMLDQPHEALEEFQMAAELFEGSDAAFDLGWIDRMIGIVLIRLGRIEEGERHVRASFDHFVAVGDLSALPLHISDFARLAVARGDREEALILSGAVAKLQAVSGTGLVDWVINQVEGLDAIRAELGTESVDRLVAEGYRLSVDEVLARVTTPASG